ncbi:MAG: type II toxin-antitoxin system Phd/YefM family antitoxin [Cyanobium sp.]
MRKVGLAEAKAQLSALLAAVEAGEEVLITPRSRPVARVVREKSAVTPASGWVRRLRELHRDQPPLQGSAVELLRELRDQEP